MRLRKKQQAVIDHIREWETARGRGPGLDVLVNRFGLTASKMFNSGLIDVVITPAYVVVCDPDKEAAAP